MVREKLRCPVMVTRDYHGRFTPAAHCKPKCPVTEQRLAWSQPVFPLNKVLHLILAHRLGIHGDPQGVSILKDKESEQGMIHEALIAGQDSRGKSSPSALTNVSSPLFVGSCLRKDPPLRQVTERRQERQLGHERGSEAPPLLRRRN